MRRKRQMNRVNTPAKSLSIRGPEIADQSPEIGGRDHEMTGEDREITEDGHGTEEDMIPVLDEEGDPESMVDQLNGRSDMPGRIVFESCLSSME